MTCNCKDSNKYVSNTYEKLIQKIKDDGYTIDLKHTIWKRQNELLKIVGEDSACIILETFSDSCSVRLLPDHGTDLTNKEEYFLKFGIDEKIFKKEYINILTYLIRSGFREKTVLSISLQRLSWIIEL